jgi:hypothetical protein
LFFLLTWYLLFQHFGFQSESTDQPLYYTYNFSGFSKSLITYVAFLYGLGYGLSQFSILHSMPRIVALITVRANMGARGHVRRGTSAASKNEPHFKIAHQRLNKESSGLVSMDL